MKNKKGFTMIELLVAVSFFGIVSSSMLSYFTQTNNLITSQTEKIDGSLFEQNLAKVIDLQEKIYDNEKKYFYFEHKTTNEYDVFSTDDFKTSFKNNYNFVFTEKDIEIDFSKKSRKCFDMTVIRKEITYKYNNCTDSFFYKLYK
ncbi:type II secretion system protein [Poseidonibacter ostreae]|uniref:Prepilin-type N-terminal cleavage/methylation domain-containing protein n=1 Tax=Poseidonibacter ostreae TaxID=2654171 RepID=A0A6L4WTS9_9BACT|nr:type II secretion system protein [Poseidonibacter ostreae]KAB7889561.1 prepilin-type N-terminal cleavage/methylation domain-containing protein [Poseidonibacter ostreae]